METEDVPAWYRKLEPLYKRSRRIIMSAGVDRYNALVRLNRMLIKCVLREAGNPTLGELAQYERWFKSEHPEMLAQNR